MEGDLEGDLERDLERELEGVSKGDSKGDFKQNMEGDLLSSSGQVRTRSGLSQVWFILQLKFNSFELDSEVGRFVTITTSSGKNEREGEGHKGLHQTLLVYRVSPSRACTALRL